MLRRSRSALGLASLAPLALLAAGLTACEEDAVKTVKPLMELEPKTIAFGDVVVGVSITETVLVKNRGEVSFVFQRASVAGDSDFITSSDSNTVVPGGSVPVTVIFQPLSTGDKTATVHFEAEGVDAQDVTVSGRGVERAISVDPRPLDFGTVLIGVRSTRQATVTNLLERDLDVSVAFNETIEPCAARPRTAPYCIDALDLDASSRLHLAAGASSTFTVELLAATEGSVRSTVTFEPCEDCGPTRLEISGNGAGSALLCDPAALDFERVHPGRCLERTVVCENVTQLPVDIVRLGIDSASNAAFSAAPFATPETLAAGDSAPVSLTFCPTVAGDARGTLEVLTDPVGELRVPLRGMGGGPAISVAPTQLNFGPVSLLVGKRRPLAITNVGSEDLIVSTYMFSDGGVSFHTAASPLSIPSGDTQVIEVELKPVAVGPASADLVIHSNDASLADLRVPLRGDGVDLPPCQAEVSPSSINFGVVVPLRIARRVVELENLSANECLIYDVRLASGTDSAFTLVEPLPETIPAHGVVPVVIEYAPQNAGTDTGALDIALSADPQPAPVTLSGLAGGGDLLVVPQDLRFGLVAVDCGSRAAQVRVHNITSGSVSISGIEVVAPNGGFVVSTLPAPLPGSPLVLGSGVSTSFDVTFRPTTARTYSGAILIHSSFAGQAADYVVSLEGTGAIDPLQTDHFVQLGSAMADILFVVDNSCSMTDEQVSLSGNFDAFIEYASREAVDYNIAVATLDNAVPGFGLFVPVNGPAADRVITPRTLPSPEAAFAMNSNVGAIGPGPEMGLEATHAALSEPFLSMHNFGFIRRDAVLSIIVVSDQPDLSPSPDDFYYSFLLSIKGAQDPGALTFSAITGEPAGCTGPGGNAEAGHRYIDMVNRTGGVSQSICTADWAQSLEQLSSTAFGFRRRFFLTGQPVMETIELKEDGVVIPTGPGTWWYDGTANAIQFSQLATPEPGVNIDVSYGIACL